MCRIAGIIDFQQPEICSKMEAMRDSMRHGGPDDSGIYRDARLPLALGVRRLALLDLSEKGHQPMAAPNGLVQLAYNGELYNFEALRLELQSLGCRFHSGTDTEVVLQAYLTWGTDCFNRFNGMFAMAFYDSRSGKIIIARDHAGMKPLYYFFDKAGRRFYFASETRALRILQPDWPEDPDWRIRLLAFGSIPEPYTTLQGVFSLPKGHYLELGVEPENFQLAIKSWYRPVIESIPKTEQEAEEWLRETLVAAVHSHQVSDAPLGLFLSGGIDSSVLGILAARKETRPLITVSLDFEDTRFSERTYQQLMSRQLGATHLCYKISQQDFQQALPDILQAMDQPSTDGINSYFISKFARQAGLTAVLSGIGADELFGGYPSFARTGQIDALSCLGPLLGIANFFKGEKWKRLSYLGYSGDEGRFLFHRGFFNVQQIGAITGFDRSHVERVLGLDRNNRSAGETSLARISRLEQDFYMQNQLLRDVDYMSMWHGLEVRMPFLDRRVMELAHATPDRLRFRSGRPKAWLIEAFRQELPEVIWNRRKMGFIFPLSAWMKAVNLSGVCRLHYLPMRERFLTGKIAWSRYWAYCLAQGGHIQTRPPSRQVLFASLRTFSAMGGIEKFNRAFALALQRNAQEANWLVTHISLYDQQPDNRYFPAAAFGGYARKQWRFMFGFLRYMRYFDTHISAHINLGILLWISGVFKKRARRILLVHGIEIWYPLTFMGKRALAKTTEIWSVSRYTALQVQTLHQQRKLPPIRIFPNTLDPFFVDSGAHLKAETFAAKPFQLLTIARLSSTEHYKGYDLVLSVLPALRQKFPGVRYRLCGSADAAEGMRLRQIVEALQLQDVVEMPGFVSEEELPRYYGEASVFVMPSRKEGFGIVFLEAAWMGLPVIAGNADGSPEALLEGRLGYLINPGDSEALLQALTACLEAPPLDSADKARRRELVEQHFGFKAFTLRQREFLSELPEQRDSA